MTFEEHIALLRDFLGRRQQIAEQIESRLLNARGPEATLEPSLVEVGQILDSCFFSQPGLPTRLTRLKGQLTARHLADGFEPIALEGPSNEFDAAALVVRARRHWHRYRWPGRSVRMAFAVRIYSVYTLHQLEHLSLRIWDDGDTGAPARLEQIQGLLDVLNAGQDAILRDARWLIQTAQGRLTRRLDPYFTTAGRIAASFAGKSRIAIHAAGAVLAGGHLRSQLRHRAAETGRQADDPTVLAVTRNSNSMDAALLVRDLVPLLEAYARLDDPPASEGRLVLADAILQGLTADPELLLVRLDLLVPCTMIETLFLQRGDDGRLHYTREGEAHLHALTSYSALIGRLAAPLLADAHALNPRDREYSPLGLVYGFCAGLLSNIALETLRPRPSPGITLGEMFESRSHLEDKRAHAEAWKVSPDLEFAGAGVDYSPGWAAEVFGRLTSALDARAARPDRANASNVADARILLATADKAPHDGAVLAQEHCLTSDLQLALATGATAFPRGQMAIDRNEARFLASVESGGKWFGVSKVVLTLCTSQGKDALLTGVSPAVAEALTLTCPGLVITDA